MPEPTLTRTRISGGIWEGILHRAGGTDAPRLAVTRGDLRIEGVELRADPEAEGRWLVRVPIPVETLSEGIQSFVIQDAATGVALESFAIAVGEADAAGIRAEVDLLRAELDMLKRAFRRHCAVAVSQD